MRIGWPHNKLSSAQYFGITMFSALLVIGITGLFLRWVYVRGRLVALPLSGNVCFDEKVAFLRHRQSKECDVLVIGSSMALNNIDSQALLRHFPAGTRLINAGAWNMKVGQTRALLDCLLKVYRPRTVIYICGTMDFYATPFPAQFFDSGEVVQFINGSFWIPVFLRHFDFEYYMHWSSKVVQSRTSRTDYLSLMFDPWGSIPLDISVPKVDWRRWNLKVDPKEMDPAQYDELGLIADSVQSRGMDLVCIQPPMKGGSVPPEASAGVDEHWRRMEAVLAKRGFHLWNLSDIHLSDEYFADYSHLNFKGAPIFSEKVSRELSVRSHPADVRVTQRSLTADRE